MSRGLESDDMPKSCLTEELQRVVREELKHVKSDLLKFFKSQFADLVTSHILDTIKDKRVQPICSLVKDDTILGEVREELEPENSHSVQLGRSSGDCQKKDANLELQFKTRLPLSLYTGQKLKGEHGRPIAVALVNANTGNIVESGRESSVKLEVVVLEGDFGTDGDDNWTQEKFEESVVKNRKGKRPLLIGNSVVTLNKGTGVLGELEFTDNSSWTPSKKFSLGLQVLPGHCENIRIRGAKMEAFTVKENRGKSNEKHFPPAPDDEVWRLKNIGRNGPFHNSLKEEKICNVKEFLQLVKTDSRKLKKILGEKMTENKWKDLLKHAETCPPNGHRHVMDDNESDHDVISDNGRQLTDHTADRVHHGADIFSLKQENHGVTIGKGSSSFPSQVSEGQIETLTPVQHNMAPRTCAAPVGPEAPPADTDSTAEGHYNGVTAFQLPVQSQNTSFGFPTGHPAHELASLVANPPISANNSNGLFSPGYHGSIIAGLPTQSRDINLQNTMPSQMIESSRMDYTGYELVLPSEPSHASFSSFQSSRTLPLPQGNHVMEDFPSINGAMSLTLPVQSQNTNSGNFMEISADEYFRLPAHQPMPADHLNVAIPPGYHGSTIAGWPTQSHGIIVQNAMPSPMIDLWSQMDYTGYDNVLHSGPSSCAPTSSSQWWSTLPRPEGDHVMEDSQLNIANDTEDITTLSL